MNITKIAVGGAMGRMGRANAALILAHPRAELSGGWERPGHEAKGSKLSSSGVLLSDDPREGMKGAQAAIDFSTPEAAMKTLEAAKESKLALVLGTTGLNDAEKAKVAEYAKLAPVIHSSNFSIGVNILWKIAAEAAKATGDDYDLEIVDIHHNMKKDSPSGTAVTTAEVLAKARGRKLEDLAIYGRHTREGKRAKGEIGIHALRAGDVVGDHTIFYAGPYERLELTHRSHARENFASGAVKAALWLVEQKKGPGLYTMAQVLGLE